MKKRTKFTLLLSFFALVGTVFVLIWVSEKPKPPAIYFSLTAPQALPDMSFEALDGSIHNVKPEPEQVVLLNFWATWCKPCVEEMPSLLRMQKALPNMRVITISLDEEKEKAQAFFETHGLTALPLYFDTKSHAFNTLNIKGMPTTLILNRHGEEISRITGTLEWDNAAVVAELQQLFN